MNRVWSIELTPRTKTGRRSKKRKQWRTYALALENMFPFDKLKPEQRFVKSSKKKFFRQLTFGGAIVRPRESGA